MLDQVADWQNRPLEPVYPLVFFDALRILADRRVQLGQAERRLRKRPNNQRSMISTPASTLRLVLGRRGPRRGVGRV